MNSAGARLHRLKLSQAKSSRSVADQRTVANIAAAAADGVAMLVFETTPMRPMAFAWSAEAAIVVP